MHACILGFVVWVMVASPLVGLTNMAFSFKGKQSQYITLELPLRKVCTEAHQKSFEIQLEEAANDFKHRHRR
jgi:hypothetical protein